MADSPTRLTTPVRTVVTRAGAVGPPGPRGLAGTPGVAGEQGEPAFDYEGVGPPGTIVGSRPGDTYLDLSDGTVYRLA